MDISVQTPPKLYPHDYLMKYLVLPLVPNAVKPNHITALRMILTPLVLWLLFNENYAFGVPLFILTASTDALDGSLARVRNQITPWGIFFDPLADKLLVGSVAILVALQYYHPALIFAGIMIDMVPSIRYAMVKNTGMVMMANIWGKIKMLLQTLSLTLLLLGLLFSLPVLITAGEVALAVSLIFAIIAVITYSL